MEDWNHVCGYARNGSFVMYVWMHLDEGVFRPGSRLPVKVVSATDSRSLSDEGIHRYGHK